MFGNFPFGRGFFAQGTDVDEPIPPVPPPAPRSAGVGGFGARGRPVPNPRLVRQHQQYIAELRQLAELNRRLTHQQDERDIQLIFSAWLNIK